MEQPQTLTLLLDHRKVSRKGEKSVSWFRGKVQGGDIVCSVNVFPKLIKPVSALARKYRTLTLFIVLEDSLIEISSPDML